MQIKIDSLKKNFTLILIATLLFSACRKEHNFLPELLKSQRAEEACLLQTESPIGRSYSSDSLIAMNKSRKSCGLITLNTKNYWVYQDSVFTDGFFTKVQNDTLRFNPVLKTLPDGLVWWEGNMSVGLPEMIFVNDSAIFTLEERLYTQGISDVKKDFSLFAGDSIRYLTNFEDAAAMGRSIKLKTSIKTPAGTFTDCIYVEKNARNYRRDQLIFKPGLGIVKYIVERAQMGERDLKIQQVLTLVSFHFE